MPVTVTPGVRFSETIDTASATPIVATLAALPLQDVPRIATPATLDADLEPKARIIWRGKSSRAIQRADRAEQTLDIPALPIGYYELRLVTAERTAIQRLNVTTLGIVVDRRDNQCVLLPVDLRSGSLRRDISLFSYDSGTFSQIGGSPSTALTNIPCQGTLVAEGSDGAVAIVSGDWQPRDGFAPASYFETDRRTYRAGDRVYYRYIAVPQDDEEWLGFDWAVPPNAFSFLTHVLLQQGTASGSFVLSADMDGGWFQTPEGGSEPVYVTPRGHAVVQAAALTPQVRAGEAARFAVSSRSFKDSLPTSVPLRYLAGFTTLGSALPLQWRLNEATKPPLVQGTIATNPDGDAVVTVPITADASAPYVELFVYDGDTLVADARAKILPENGRLEFLTPAPGSAPGCFPVGTSLTDSGGVPIRARIDLSGPGFREILSTNAAGYGYVRICSKERGVWALSAHEIGGRALTGAAEIFPELPGQNVAPTVLLFPDTNNAKPHVPVRFTAISNADGVALVHYGSADDYRTLVTVIKNGIAHFSALPPPEMDDFRVRLLLFHDALAQSNVLTVHVPATPHRLHVRTGCAREGVSSRGAMMCVEVRNWRGAGVAAKLFVTVTRATPATLATERGRVDDVYRALNWTSDPPNILPMSWTWAPGVTPKLSLLPPLKPCPVASIPHPSPAASPLATAPPSPPQPSLPPHTIAWLDNVRTARNGVATLRLHWPLRPQPGVYLLKVTAVSDDVNGRSAGTAITTIVIR